MSNCFYFKRYVYYNVSLRSSLTQSNESAHIYYDMFINVPTLHYGVSSHPALSLPLVCSSNCVSMTVQWVGVVKMALCKMYLT